MPIDDRWDRLTPTQWDDFAKAWLEEQRDGGNSNGSDLGQSVVWMSFTARPDQQWQFILAAVGHAQSNHDLGNIAAGTMEHLLGWYGNEFIAHVEEQAAIDSKFARMLTGVWKYKMSDEIWERVRAIQAAVPQRLHDSDDDDRHT